jgi:hypothetical protein
MKDTTLNRSDREFFKLMAIGATAALLAISAMSTAQEAIKLPAKSNFRTVETFKNKQGFSLPVSVSDTTNVYKIGDNGTPFYFRQSKKTGLIYKVYIKKDSVKVVTSK